MKPTANIWGYLRSGALAGALSAFTFAIIHHIFISDIWFSVIMMMVAGAVCGLCIAWSYRLLVEAPSIGSWLRYNMLYVGMLALLGAASVFVYEPVTTIAALVEANEPPDELFGQAMPMTIVFTLASAVVISLLYRRSWLRIGAILLTCTVLVLLLGLNVSVIGLVFIPRGSLYLVVELFGLILAINWVYVAAFIALERKSLLPSA
ncbi:MAG: hypothetical protein JSV81_21085 [Anaerolineales bacterium]|nr:MAG: hypothetical protein JSV81_21085 [Anaerolineales bacterium]